MAFGAFNPHRQQSMMSDINVTPMVDVMLVLLIIFILAAPMFTQALRLELPQAQAGAAARAPAITIAVDAAGVIYWNGDKLEAGQLESRMAGAAAMAPQPELQLRADKNTRYEVVAHIMAAAQMRGLNKIGFITDPNTEKKHGQR